MYLIGVKVMHIYCYMSCFKGLYECMCMYIQCIAIFYIKLVKGIICDFSPISKYVTPRYYWPFNTMYDWLIS